MKKIYLISVLLLFAGMLSIHAQERKHCYTDEVYKEAVAAHPEILASEQQLEQFTRQFIQHHQAERRTNTNGTASVLYIIPLVFHVIHEYGPENISDAQIIDAVNILNRDYRRLNADTVDIIPDFKPLCADVEIEFRLATLDPNGNCTNGIDRVVSFRTFIGDDLAKLNQWDPTMYLNIWTIASFSAAHASAAAYAYRPGAIPNPAYDGVIALSSYVGSIGTSNGTNSRTLTHEIGHCLNLSHPWGNTNNPGVACGDDNVSDTPITKGWDHCPSSNYDVCNPGINENFQNYMDYSYCDCMFTYGQKSRMVAALNSPVSGRNNLWTTANLMATGTAVSSTPQLCAPIADLYSFKDHICTGDSVQFFSASRNADTMGYAWTFPHGSPSTSANQHPYITYDTAGVFDAKLVVSNASGADSITKTMVVTVSGPPAYVPNYFNDFETASNFPEGDGYVISNAGNQWQRYTSAGFSGTACIRMLNYNQSQAGLVDAYVTPAVNMFGNTNPALTFRLAYARKDTSKTDVLKVYISTTCGKLWTLRRSLSGSQLATTANVTGSFIPTSATQWALISVPVAPISNKPNVRIKFEFTSGGDNNIYIDDINITADPTSVQEQAIGALAFDVYPNPASDELNISYDMPSANHVEVSIFDLPGREIQSVTNGMAAEGLHELHVNTSTFSKGIYLVRLKAGDLTTVRKLVID